MLPRNWSFETAQNASVHCRNSDKLGKSKAGHERKISTHSTGSSFGDNEGDGPSGSWKSSRGQGSSKDNEENMTQFKKMRSREPQEIDEAEIELISQGIKSLISKNQDISLFLFEVNHWIGNSRAVTPAAPQDFAVLSIDDCTEYVQNLAALSNTNPEKIATALCVQKLSEIINKIENEECNLWLCDEDLCAAENIVKLSQELYKEQRLNRRDFIAFVTRLEIISLDIIWLLHQSNLITISQLLQENSNRANKLAEQLLKAIVSLETLSENQLQSVKGILSTLVMYGHVEILEELEHNQDYIVSTETALVIMDSVMKGIVETHFKSQTARLPTLTVVDMLQCSFVDNEILIKFLSHQILSLITHNPIVKVAFAYSHQAEWTYGKLPMPIKTLFSQIVVNVPPREFLGVLHRVLTGKREVNWRTVLSLISVFVGIGNDCKSIKCLIDDLLREGFQNFILERLVTAFLIARQMCLEENLLYPSYMIWFKVTFDSSNSVHACNKKTFEFFVKFLTSLVPHDLAIYMKAHLMKQPFIVNTCRLVWFDYVGLVKARLSELNESLDTLGLYEANLPDGTRAENTKAKISQAQADVEKALEGFEKTGKIPSTVNEAIVFRKPFYIGHFLPALLAPRELPEVPDSRMKFIDLLLKAGKIPRAEYSAYEQGCKKEKENRVIIEID